MWALAPAGAAPSAPAASAPADTIAAMDTPRHVVREGFRRICVIGIILAPRLSVPSTSSRAPMTQGAPPTGSRSGSVDGSYNCKELAKNCPSGEWRTRSGTARAPRAAARPARAADFVGTGAYPGAVADEGAASAGSQERFEDLV